MAVFGKAKEMKEAREAPALAGIPTWQYKRVLIAGQATSEDVLNVHGSEGWEVCGVIEEKMGTQVLLKRQSGIVPEEAGSGL